jgi:hypothetical protein
MGASSNVGHRETKARPNEYSGHQQKPDRLTTEVSRAGFKTQEATQVIPFIPA